MTKKHQIGKELYMFIGTKQVRMGQMASSLGQKGHTLGQNGTQISYFIVLYTSLSLSSLYIKKRYKKNIVLRERDREHRIEYQGRKFVKKFRPSKKLYNIDKKQLFLSINVVYCEKGGLFCPKVAKKSLGQAI